jgi:MFS family permease
VTVAPDQGATPGTTTTPAGAPAPHAGAPAAGSPPGTRPAPPPLWPYLLVVFLITSGFGAVFTMLAELRDQFGFSDFGVGLIASSGFFAGLVSQLGLARYADRGHSIAMIRLGLLVAVGSMAMMAVAGSLWFFVASRGALGVGAGLVIPAARRIVIASDPVHVGTNLGRLGAADIAGFIFGPAVSAALVELGGVRAPFIALGVVIVVALPFAMRAAVDPGAIDLERRPVRGLLRVRAVLAVISLATGFYVMIGTFDSVWAVLMTDNGAQTWVIGVTITIFALPMIVMAPIGGRLAQRHGGVRTALLGLCLALPCMFSYGFLGSILALSIVATLQGFFDAVTFPSVQVAIAFASPKEQLAAAQGLLGAVELAAAGTMALIAAAVYDAGGATPTFLLTTGVMLATALLGAALAGPLLRERPA